MMYGNWVQSRLKEQVVVDKKTGKTKPKYTLNQALGIEPETTGTLEQLLISFGSAAQRVN